MDRYQDDEYDNISVVPCKVCGRSFAPQTLARHQPICAKSSRKQRKVFNSAKQRAEGTDIPTVRKTRKDPVSSGSRYQSKEPQARKNNWRQKHEDFVNTIRAARGVKLAMERGGPLPPPPPPSYNPDYIQCDYCGRRFAESAAERHINFCKQKNQRLPASRSNQSIAAQKQATRTQYQAPKLKTSTSSSGYGSSASQPSAARGVVKSGSYTGTPSQTGAPTRGPSTRNMATYGSSGNIAGRAAPSSDESRQLNSKPRTTSTYQTSSTTGVRAPVGSTRAPAGSIRAPAGSTRAPVGSTRAPAGNTRVPSGGVSSGSRVSKPAGQSSDYLGNFCMECGSRFPSAAARSCAKCGARK